MAGRADVVELESWMPGFPPPPPRVDDWEPEYSHGWETWRLMLPDYLANLT